MPDDDRLPDVVRRARLADQTVKRGDPLPGGDRTPGALVEWRGAGCGHRLLRVFLTTDGWVLDVTDYKVRMPEWIARQNPDGTADLNGVPLTIESYMSGQFAAIYPGVITGMTATLPLAVDEWPNDGRRFEVGCCHATSLHALADLAADCRTARTSRLHPVLRKIEHMR